MDKKTRIIQIAVFAVVAVMFVAGAISPEVGVVFKKATNICLECIGIGG